MNKISGVYSLENNQNITIASDLGFINNYQDQIILSNDVKIGYEDYVMMSEILDFDLRTKSAASDKFVQIIGEDGSISADKFKTTGEFKQITFDGNVEANFNVSHNN
jgi:LPS export ABC transporter protein LptC